MGFPVRSQGFLPNTGRFTGFSQSSPLCDGPRPPEGNGDGTVEGIKTTLSKNSPVVSETKQGFSPCKNAFRNPCI